MESWLSNCAVAYTREDGSANGERRLRLLELTELRDFARSYTAAWCSQDHARVAAHFSPDGSLTINDGAAAVGRAAIAAAAQNFMTAFPDLLVSMDRVEQQDGRAEYHWTLTGTNTGPDGTGHVVRISGFESWTMGDDGMIAESQGHFDSGDYQRQLAGVVGSLEIEGLAGNSAED
jgi:steroid delta-isomerase-like uncharacterized protein